MLKSLRKKFVLSAMAAFFTVICLIAVSISLWNFQIMIQMQDRTLDQIRMFRGQPPESLKEVHFPTPFSFIEPDPEAEYTTRFFTVICLNDGATESVSMSYIGSVDEPTANEYASRALKRKLDRGFLDYFRYLRYQEGNKTHIIFLNCAAAMQHAKTLILVSFLVGLCSLVLVFLLLVLFSNKAIKPYLINIEQQKRFITDASHELKTPLTSISTSAAVIAEEYGESEWVVNIQRQVIKMSRLIANLVTLSRLDEELPFPEKVNFSISDAAWEIIEPFEKQAIAKNLEFQKSIEDNLTYCGDKASIQQMLSILLDNAVRYSSGKIRFDLYQRHGNIVIEIFNTLYNCGKLNTERLFDRFYRPDESRSEETGGYGIGLSIAKAVVETHNGKISATCPDASSIIFHVIL